MTDRGSRAIARDRRSDQRVASPGAQVRLFNVLEGHGVGKLLVGFVGGAARKDAPECGQRVKEAVEAS